MTIYMTKVWGFGEPCGPLQFASEGWRQNALDKLQDGDTVILVGTKNEKTDVDEQGKILGMMEPSREPVLSLDFELEPLPEHFDQDHNYKSPYGLLNRRAWIFEEPRAYLSDVSTRSFAMNSAQGIVALNSEEEKILLRLPRREVGLLNSIRTNARLYGETEARRRGAPPPSTIRRGIMHMRDAPAYTYLMEISDTRKSFKIGWAFDFKIRESQFNLAALPSLGGLRYKTVLKELWESARQAYRMEQELLREYDKYRIPSNREVLSDVKYETLVSSWATIMQSIRKSNK